MIQFFNGSKNFRNTISYTNEPFEMLDKIDALIICTEWDEFKNINIQKIPNKT